MKELDIKDLFIKFSKKHRNPFDNLGEFFADLESKFIEIKNKQYNAEKIFVEDIPNKIRQGWVSFVGKQIEEVILLFLNDFCTKNNIKITKDKDLKNPKTDELDLVRRAILVHFGDYSEIPDADIILYSTNKDNLKILCVLSIKNSFRERYTQTPYWKLKFLQNKNTKHIKVFMITPDNDDEVSVIKNNKPKKLRVVMEFELDGIYLAKEKFIKSKKVKNIYQLLDDIKKLL